MRYPHSGMYGYLPAVDSLTQIVLGAAVGELAAGRRLGNRAMLWGALAGTIPDLDVTAGWVADPITSLAFHRCVTHSLYYAVLASPVLAWMAHALYNSPDGRPEPHYLARVWLPGTALVYALLLAGSWLSQTPLRGVPVYAAVVTAVTVAVPLALWAYRSWRPRAPGAGQTHFGDWLAIFLLGIGTHPLLDCFTTYGTQVLQPFDDLRVSWNTISVVDPAYTLPFLLLLLAASRVLRRNPWRRRLTWAGVGMSTAYLAFTCFNLWRVREQVATDLGRMGIVHQRFSVTPTLFQNVLWNVTIDQGDTMRIGQLGLLDEPFQLSPKHLMPLAKQDDLLAPAEGERAVTVARWFSEGYYVVAPGTADTVDFFDLRFGILPSEGATPVFGFQLYPRAPGEEWGFRQKPFQEKLDVGQALGDLWTRIHGGGLKTATEGEALPKG